MAGLARLAGKAQHDGLELDGQLLGQSLLGGGAAGSGGFHLVNYGLVGQGSLQRQLAGQQKIAAVAVGHLHHVSAVAQIDYVFLQNDFHDRFSCVRSASTISPSTKSVWREPLTVSGRARRRNGSRWLKHLHSPCKDG